MTSILIVEDEQAIRILLCQVLDESMRDIEAVISCEQARAALRRRTYEVAIVDKNLPDGSGIDLAREIKQADPLTEVLLATAYPSMESAIEAVKIGVFEYLTKPFDDIASVELKVRNASEKSQLRREQLRLRRALEQSEERYRTLFNGSPDAIVVCDARTRMVREVNDAAASLFGRPREDLVGVSAFSLYQEDDDTSRDDAVSPATTARLGRGLVRQGIHVEVASTQFEIGGEPMLLNVIRDVTERVRQQQKQDQLRDELRHAQKMQTLGQLAGGIAHDFNNLITALNCFGAFLADSISLLPDPIVRAEAESDLEQIRHAAGHAATITRQLLAFSRKEMIQPVVVSINQIIYDLEMLLRASIGADVSLHTVLASDLWNVKLDATQIEQVIINLAFNARDAMPGGGTVTIESRNVYLASKNDRYVEVCVRDTGGGVEPSLLEEIFDPFFTTKGRKGTGLGLATVRSIVEQAGGEVFASPNVQVGAEFIVRIPVTDEPRVNSLMPTVRETEVNSDATVLVVDDEDGVRRAVCRLLRSAGYRVREARSGEEAIGILSSADLLLTDVVLTGMSGNELAHEARARRPLLPVVFMTGYATHEQALETGEFRNVPLVPKPFRGERLLSVIAGAMGEIPARRQDKRT